MASLNRVDLIGNLGADPEIKTFSNGGKVANLRVACSESWKDRQTGERKERTEWVSVAITSDGLVSVAERFLRKGSKVFVSGSLRTRKWQDQSGQDRYTTEVVLQGYGAQLLMLDGKGEGQPRREPDGSRGAPMGGSSSFPTDLADDLDDDIPFARNDTAW